MNRSRNPVSRVDSGRTHGFFARVYRANWVGSRSFADRQYGGRTEAEDAAHKWVTLADECLPVIPAKPVLAKATVHVRSDPKNPGSRYYDVYLPPTEGQTQWSQKFYFQTLDEQKRQRERANTLARDRNIELRASFLETLGAWQQEHDRIMEEILRLWPTLKAMSV